MKKRDLTQAQLEYRLRKMGWKPQGVFGYWKRNGLSVSLWNYPRRRDAERSFRHFAERDDAEKAANRPTKAAT